MKVLLAQTNTTPGDFSGNVAQIEAGIVDAAKKDADMVVFPELSIPGYLCKDMMFQHQFVRTNLMSLHNLIQFSASYPKLAIVVGYIDINKTGIGKPFRNMLAVIKGGTVIGEY